MKNFRAKAFIEWIGERIPKEKWSDSGDTPQEAALWVACIDEGQQMKEEYTVRGLAEMILTGSTPYTLDDLESWLESAVESDDDDVIPRTVKDSTLKFFGEV